MFFLNNYVLIFSLYRAYFRKRTRRKKRESERERGGRERERERGEREGGRERDPTKRSSLAYYVIIMLSGNT